jgi:hypothetical protein
MSFFFDKIESEETPVILPPNYAGQEVGFFDGVQSGFQAQTRGHNTDVYAEMLFEKLSPVVRILNARKDQDVDTFATPGSSGGVEGFRGGREQARIRSLQRMFDYIKTNPQKFPEYQDLDMDEIDEEILNQAREEIKIGDNVSQRLTTSGAIGSFVGTVGGLTVNDNFIDAMVTAVLLAPMRSIGLARAVIAEFFIGAGTEAILQPQVKEWYETLGREYTWQDVYANIIAGGVFGAALPVGAKAVSLGFNKLRGGIDALADAGLVKEQDANLARGYLDDAEIESEIPPGVSYDDHIARLDRNTDSLYSNRTPELDEPSGGYETSNSIPDVEQANPERLANDIAEIADDEIILLDDPITDSPSSFTGAQIKAQSASDDALIERFKGCIA